MSSTPRFDAPLPNAAARRLALALLVPLLVACGGRPGEGPSADPRQPADPEVSTLADLGGVLDDAMLGLRVRGRLLEHMGADAVTLDLAVEGGLVTLSGRVDAAADKPLAEEVARSVDGVTAVTNRIEVAAKDPQGRPVTRAVGAAERELADAVLLTRVKLQLAQELRTAALDIDVDVREGIVSLRGTLPDRASQRLALAVARAVPGVAEVHDLLSVAH